MVATPRKNSGRACPIRSICRYDLDTETQMNEKGEEFEDEDFIDISGHVQTHLRGSIQKQLVPRDIIVPLVDKFLL